MTLTVPMQGNLYRNTFVLGAAISIASLPLPAKAVHQVSLSPQPVNATILVNESSTFTYTGASLSDIQKFFLVGAAIGTFTIVTAAMPSS